MEPARIKRLGPYPAERGYLFWDDYFDDGSRKTAYVHRETMEAHIGRALTTDEVVHHDNEDPTDNRLENLVVMSNVGHAKHHAASRPPVKMLAAVCPVCGAGFLAKASTVRKNQARRGSAGPFCGKACAGTWSQKQGASARAPVGHGMTRYRLHGCRCDVCRAANAASQRRYVEAKRAAA